MASIAWLKEVNRDEVAIVGDKAAYLGEVFSVVNVPTGFVVKTHAFDRFISEHREKIEAVLKEAGSDFKLKSDKVQGLIKGFEVPVDIKNDVARAYVKLGAGYDQVQSAHDLVHGQPESLVAVRANLFIKEDQSFMGTASKLGVSGAEKIVKALRDCWAEVFTLDAVEFMDAENLSIDDVTVSVIIQKMVFAHKTAIIYSVNPEGEDDDELAIDACWGAGEYLANDDVEVDNYVVDKINNSLKHSNVKPQDHAFIFDKKTCTITKKTIPESERSIKVLKEEEVARLSSLAKKIEQALDEPVQVEVLVEKDKLYVIQISSLVDEDAEEDDESEEGNEELDEEYEDDYDVADEETDDATEDSEEYNVEDADVEVGSRDAGEEEYELYVSGEETNDDEEIAEQVEAEQIENNTEEFEAEIRKIVEKYSEINPSLKKAFELMGRDVVEVFKKFLGE